MQIARVQHEALALPISALVCDGVFYDPARLSAPTNAFASYRGCDFHTRVFSLGAGGLSDLYDQLRAGRRPSEARLREQSFVVLPPCDPERAAYLQLGPHGLPSDTPRYAQRDARGLLGHDQPVPLPHGTEAPHVEAGLAAVLADELWRAPPEEANKAVLGFTLLLDWTARPETERWQCCPLGPDAPSQLGPFIVTPDEMKRWTSPELTLTIGGRDAATRPAGGGRVAWAASLSFLSHAVPLRAGDIVGLGSALTEQMARSAAPLGYGERVELSLGAAVKLRGWAVPGPETERWRLSRSP